MERQPLLIQGMHGMGDCLHQRAVLRQLLPTRRIWLETSWPAIYHDLDVVCVRRPVALRTQTKNALREQDKFGDRPPDHTPTLRISYRGDNVATTKSKTVLEAMCNVAGIDYGSADYRLPVPDSWFDALEKLPEIVRWRASGKPLLVYRPLVARPEWRGSIARNADPLSYAHLLATIRDDFFVVSIADLEPGREWLVEPDIEVIPDVAFHQGELTFEAIAALFARADVIFTASGFAAILGPAVGTPVVNVVGGYEPAGAHSSGERFVPMLNIGPDVPCNCFSSACRQACDKRFDVAAAAVKLKEFMSSQICIQISDKALPLPAGEAPAPGPLATPFQHPQSALYRQMGLKA